MVVEVVVQVRGGRSALRLWMNYVGIHHDEDHRGKINSSISLGHEDDGGHADC